MSRLSDEVHDRVAEAISNLAVNPRPHGSKKLVGKGNNWRIRVGDYRVLHDELSPSGATQPSRDLPSAR